MALVGTPANIASGGTYTPESGSNRVVVALALHKAATAQSLTNIAGYSVTRTPAVQANDSAGGNRDSAGICLFKESELGGSNVLTATWSGTPSSVRLVCFTFDGVDQVTTIRASTGTGFGNGTVAACSAMTGLTVGDFCVGGVSLRSSGTFAQNNSFTEVFDGTNGDGGTWCAAYKTAAASSETYSATHDVGDDWAAVSLALIPYAAVAATNYRLLLMGVG